MLELESLLFFVSIDTNTMSLSCFRPSLALIFILADYNRIHKELEALGDNLLPVHENLVDIGCYGKSMPIT